MNEYIISYTFYQSTHPTYIRSTANQFFINEVTDTRVYAKKLSLKYARGLIKYRMMKINTSFSISYRIELCNI